MTPTITHQQRWFFLYPLLVFLLLIQADSSFGRAKEEGPDQFQPRRHRIPYVPGEVLVRFKDRVSPNMRARAHQRVPSRTVKRMRSLHMELVQLHDDESVDVAVARYRALPEVLYAQPNYIYYPCETNPDDGFFSNLWGLNNTGQRVNFTSGTPDADIDAPEAWDLETGKSDVVIAVIDTGVDYRHPDLANNIWVNGGEIPENGIDDDGNGFIDDSGGWDFFDNDPDPMDPDGHGTHVAGIVGAEGNNEKGITGVGWRLRIMALKVGGSAGFFTTSRLTGAIDYATSMGAQVINASWGGDFFDQAVRDAISRANNGGVLFVAAAGNAGKDIDSSPFYPASYDLENIISAAATDQNDQLAHFSNFGVTSVDVGAPGTNILSTYVKRMTLWNDDFDDGIISDWTHGGVKDSWGLSSDLSLSTPFSLADSPGGNYENNTSAWIKRDIDLTGSSAAVLSGMIRGSSEEFVDRLFVQTSADDAIWITRETEIIFNSESSFGLSISGIMDDVWRFFKTDIGSIDGSFGHFRFLFDTNGASVDDGWYLDDLVITVTATSTENDLKYLQGTSMATPMVSGLAGLILSSNPDLTHLQVKSIIISSVDSIDSLNGKVASGGRINALNSLTSPVPVITTSSGGGGCRIAGTGGGTLTKGIGWLLPSMVIFACFVVRRRK
jgi:subtilisin family serine protease